MGVLIENMHAYIQGDYVKNSSMNVDNPDLEQLQKELDKMGTAMHRLTERLEDEQQHTKTLISDISHQLKTPLAALKINYELLEDKALLWKNGQNSKSGKKRPGKTGNTYGVIFSNVQAGTPYDSITDSKTKYKGNTVRSCQYGYHESN